VRGRLAEMTSKRLVFLNHVQHGCIHLLRCRGPIEHFGRVIPALSAQGCEQGRSRCNGQGRPEKRASLHHTSSSAADRFFDDFPLPPENRTPGPSPGPAMRLQLNPNPAPASVPQTVRRNEKGSRLLAVTPSAAQCRREDSNLHSLCGNQVLNLSCA